MEVTYHPLTRQDLIRILRYYRGVSERLPEEFRTELRSTIDRIASNPLRYTIVGDGVRRANLHRFPFNVLYEIQNDTVRVLVIRHHKRDPQFGLDRLN